MLALEGIKVLDLTHLVPGQFCTMILGDLGAEVIKIEAPSELSAGMRIHMSPQGEDGRLEAATNALNRNKKSVVLNLKLEAGRQIFNRLSQMADVIVEGFRPGVADRLGIGYGSIKGINPGIIYCSLSGYGQDGPYSSVAGHDVNYVSVSGVLDLIGRQDGPPVIPLNLVADFAGGSLYGVIGILSALIARGRTGLGQHVDTAYVDGAISLLTWFANDYFFDGSMRRRGETWLHGAYPYYGVYETKDNKYVSIGCLEPWFWENLCRVLGKEDYIPYHFVPEHGLCKPEGDKWDEIWAYMKQTFLTKTSDEWFDLLSKENVPIAKVYTFKEVFSDPQVLHRQMMVEIEHPTLGKVRQVGIAIKLSETPGTVRSLSPLLGEHTEEVLLGLGYRSEELAELRHGGVIG